MCELNAFGQTLCNSTAWMRYTMSRPNHTKNPAPKKNRPQKLAEYLQDIFALEIATANFEFRIRDGDDGANVLILEMS